MIIKNASERVLVIPDMQLPFHHRDSLAFLTYMKKKFKPTRVVNVGDWFDKHALSDHVVNPDGFSPGHELEAAQSAAEGFYKLFPKCELILGNHDMRLERRCMKAGIPLAYMRPAEDWLQTPKGWNIHSHSIAIDHVLYIHGIGYSGINGHRRAAMANMRSTVIGHLHANAGIAYLANKDKLIFGMNVGCLIDNDSYAMAYGKYMPNKPILGAGIVDKGVPQYYPMLLTKSGRWIGRLV